MIYNAQKIYMISKEYGTLSLSYIKKLYSAGKSPSLKIVTNKDIFCRKKE